MLKTVTAGVTAFLIAASPPVFAQEPSAGASERLPSAGASERLTAADWEALTEARIKLVKAALQLTPDQEKLWPPIENAIRVRAMDRQIRFATIAERARELRDRSRIEVLRDRNPIEFMQRRADRLVQRAADLNRLAEAWQPLYQTLQPDQKQRLAFLAIFAIRELRDAAEERRVRSEDDNDDELSASLKPPVLGR